MSLPIATRGGSGPVRHHRPSCLLHHLPQEDPRYPYVPWTSAGRRRWKVDGNQFQYDGNLDLIKAVLNHFEVRKGFDMFLHCEAPPGSGLGGILDRHRGHPRGVLRMVEQTHVSI